MTRCELYVRLTEAGISMRPDDNDALSVIEKYVNDYRVGGKGCDGGEAIKLCEHMEKLKLVSESAADNAEDIGNRVVVFLTNLVNTLEAQVDDWGGRDLLRDFVFSYSDEDRKYAVKSFVALCTQLASATRKMSELSGGAAAEIDKFREYSSLALLLASELKYASYAARVSEKLVAGERYFEMSDSARREAECAERLSEGLHRAIRALSVSGAAISAAVANASAALGIDDGIDDVADDFKSVFGDHSVSIRPKRAAAALNAAASTIRAAINAVSGFYDEQRRNKK